MIADIELDTTFFSNERALRVVVQKYGPQAPSMLRRYGVAAWEYMCYRYEGFKCRHISESLMQEYKMSKRTAETVFYACVTYCLEARDDFKGPSSILTKMCGGNYKLVDGSMEGYE